MMRTRKMLWGILPIMLLASWGCASAGGSGGGGETASDTRDVITEADLEGLDQLNVFEVVRRLKPNWLRYRGQSVLMSPEREGLRVYLDGTYYGDAESMSTIRVPNVQEIRFLDARQATLRFGTGHTVGAILITSRR